MFGENVPLPAIGHPTEGHPCLPVRTLPSRPYPRPPSLHGVRMSLPVPLIEPLYSYGSGVTEGQSICRPQRRRIPFYVSESSHMGLCTTTSTGRVTSENPRCTQVVYGNVPEVRRWGTVRFPDVPNTLEDIDPRFFRYYLFPTGCQGSE